MEDPRVSDDATGLPPLEEVDPADTLLVLAWAGSEGIASMDLGATSTAVRYLSVRGLVRMIGTTDPQWAQVHIAVPAEHVEDVARALVFGLSPRG